MSQYTKPTYQTQELDEIIASSIVKIHSQTFSYVKFNKGEDVPPAFMVSEDEEEITVVTCDDLQENPVFANKGIVGPFKLFEICVSQPFIAKGFLATVTHTISNALINNLVISTFSKDYVLVREEYYQQAMDLLKERGFPVQEL